MPNMSYCRFHNTRADLNDCLDAIREGKLLGADEARDGRRMFVDFLDFCRENYIITGYEEDEIKALFDGRTEKEEDDDE